jgi:photosystem II stability/assembly factor-like uncharacterized protein
MDRVSAPATFCRRLKVLPFLAALFTCTLVSISAFGDDLSSTYQWKPVRIGGGGWVVGMVIHPLDTTVRYARTDVGNAYRWDQASQQWIPMRVSNSDGSGIQSVSATSAPSGYGIEAIAADPTNTSVDYIVFPTAQSCDIQCPTSLVEIYKSVDGGRNFTPGNMTASAILGNPNGSHRWAGERLAVDPANPQVLYYGSDSQGVYRSTDGGTSWTQITGASAPPANIEFVNIQFAKTPGTITVNGIVVSKVIYAVSINNSDAGGDVYQSSDGGQTWADISTGVTDTASGQSLVHQALSSSIDSNDALYVAENSATDGNLRAYWRFAAGQWTRFSLESGGTNFINQPVVSVAVDPTNAQRIYALGSDTSLARSDNGGQTWTNLGSPQYANTLGWLPQTVGMQNGEWHSNGGLKIDSSGNLWTPTGQEGPLTIASATAGAATSANPPRWTIVTTGIEEMVSEDVTIPPGSGDTIVVSAMDATGFVISNPDNFSAIQIPLQQEIISQGTSVDYASDAPSFVAVTTSNVYTNGPNYSGYSTNGGRTWQRFASVPRYTCGANTCDIPAGIVAISARGTRALGSDHIVFYPPEGFAPQYSQDGGATWHVTQSFPLNSDGVTINTANYSSFLYAQLSQHLLRADPFTPDKFYLKFTHAPSMLYISTDGGQTWTGQPNAALPDYAWEGQLAVNRFVKDDLWYADGWEGSTAHGVFHSTDGGQTFQQLAGISHAIVIAIGASSGQPADALYTVYFYGQLSSDPRWGVFRSTNGGTSWDRVAYYPTGTFDRPTTMAASQDTFGKVYIGLSGESFVYGQPAAAPPPQPVAPTALSALAVSNTEIDLAWTAPSGVVSSYNIYRGTSAGAESATPLASGVTQASYADKSPVQGQTYYYKVTALNPAGEGPASNEASALAAVPVITLAPAGGSSSSVTINPGQSATFKLVLSSTNYSGTVTFVCAGAPVGYTCAVPNPVALATATTSTSITVTVQPATSAAVRPFRLLIPAAATLAVLPFFFLRLRRSSVALATAAAAVFFSIAGCGGGSGSNTSSNQPVTSTLTVTASGANVASATQTLSLTIQ